MGILVLFECFDIAFLLPGSFLRGSRADIPGCLVLTNRDARCLEMKKIVTDPIGDYVVKNRKEEK